MQGAPDLSIIVKKHAYPKTNIPNPIPKLKPPNVNGDCRSNMYDASSEAATILQNQGAQPQGPKVERKQVAGGRLADSWRGGGRGGGHLLRPNKYII